MIYPDPHVILGWLTLAAQVGLVSFVFLFLFCRHSSLFRRILSLVHLHSVLLGFLVALSGMLLSLYYSDILGYEPCRFCWFQRIFLYPQVFILGTAMWLKKKDVFFYILPLCILGFGIAGYHYSLQMVPSSEAVTTCSVTGHSCTSTELLELGYITIPLMSATSFALLLLLCFVDWWVRRTSLKT